MTLVRQEAVDRLRLLRSQGVGPITWRALMGRFGSASRAIENLPLLASRGKPKAGYHPCAQTKAEAELAQIKKIGAQPLFLGEPDYPPLLAMIEDAPPILYAKGDVGLLSRPMLAVVGSRNASAAGRRIAELIVNQVGTAGYVVVSGLARGIDSVAHRASLATGSIAVIAGGIDVPPTSETKPLYDEVLQSGLLVSEMPPGTISQARHYPRRNRIVAGLSMACLVVEAAARSGSLITADCAILQNREVLCVPGSPLDPRSQGTNNLIRDGAALIQSGQDVINILQDCLERSEFRSDDQRFARSGDGYLAPPAVDTLNQGISDEARTVVESLLSPVPVAIEALIEESSMPAEHLQIILLELELSGRLERHIGQRVALIDFNGSGTEPGGELGDQTALRLPGIDSRSW